jgi:hypothetical protein
MKWVAWIATLGLIAWGVVEGAVLNSRSWHWAVIAGAVIATVGMQREKRGRLWFFTWVSALTVVVAMLVRWAMLDPI